MAKFDWEKIEKEFRVGQLSVREIAKQHGCGESTIRMRMKRNGITRDLAKKVAQRVREKMVCADVRTDRADDEQKINEASDRGVEVLTLHRKDIAKLREEEQNLLAELEDSHVTKVFCYQGEVITHTLDESVSTKCQALNSLASVLQKRICLEREAFSLNSNILQKPTNDTGLPGHLIEMIKYLHEEIN